MKINNNLILISIIVIGLTLFILLNQSNGNLMSFIYTSPTVPTTTIPVSKDTETIVSALNPDFIDPYYFYDPFYWYGGWYSRYPNNYYNWHDDTHHRPGHKYIPHSPRMSGLDSHRSGGIRTQRIGGCGSRIGGSRIGGSGSHHGGR
jgi:hypothetical protein